MREHKHLFEIVGNTWACFGHDDACGQRAPACFTPVESAVTKKGLIDLLIGDRILFIAVGYTDTVELGVDK